MSNTVDKPFNMKTSIGKERLDAVKALKSDIVKVEDEMKALSEELKMVADHMSISIAQLRDEFNQLKTDMRDSQELQQNELYDTIEQYIVQTTPRGNDNGDLTDIKAKMSALEEKLDKFASKDHTKKLIRPGSTKL